MSLPDCVFNQVYDSALLVCTSPRDVSRPLLTSHCRQLCALLDSLAQQKPETPTVTKATSLVLDTINLCRTVMLWHDVQNAVQLRDQYLEDGVAFVRDKLGEQQQLDRVVVEGSKLLASSPLLKTRCIAARGFNLTLVQLLMYHVIIQLDPHATLTIDAETVKIMTEHRHYMAEHLASVSSHVFAQLSKTTSQVIQSVRYLYCNADQIVRAVSTSLNYIVIILQTFDKLIDLEIDVNYLLIILMDMLSALNFITSPDSSLTDRVTGFRTQTVNIIKYITSNCGRLNPYVVNLVTKYLNNPQPQNLAHLAVPVHVTYYTSQAVVNEPMPDPPRRNVKRKNPGRLYEYIQEDRRKKRQTERQLRKMRQQQQTTSNE